MSFRLSRTVLALAVALAGGLTLLPSSSSASSSRDELWVRFEGVKPGRTLAHVRNSGKSKLGVSVLTANGGRLVARKASFTKSRVADFPDYVGGGGAPKAVIGVVNRGADRLSPGSHPFTVGVDFKIDAVAIGSVDDGNNLLQRGNFGSPSQYKLQVDKGHIGCRIKGHSGATLLVATSSVSSSRWYRVSCSLQNVQGGGQREVLRISTLNKRGRAHALETVTGTTTVGPLPFPVKRPMSIGGKLKDSLRLPNRVEQFNGRLDNAFFRID
jgi:hypothetical protein